MQDSRYAANSRVSYFRGTMVPLVRTMRQTLNALREPASSPARLEMEALSAMVAGCHADAVSDLEKINAWLGDHAGLRPRETTARRLDY